MADENTNAVVPPEPAAEGDNAPKDGAATTTPDPVAPGQNAAAEVAPQAEATPETGADTIRDSEAYFKAQAEKFERLFKKAEEEAQAAQKRLADREGVEVQEINQRFETLQAELTEARATAERERLTAMKLRVGVQHGLSDDLALRLVGDTEEALAEDAQRLSKAIPSTRKANVGNPAGQSDGSSAWRRGQIDPLTGERIN